MKKIRGIFVFGLLITAFAGSMAFAGENNDPAQGHCTDTSNLGQADAPKSENSGAAPAPKPVYNGQGQISGASP